MQANELLAETFGDRYVDLRKYMVNEAIYDAEITPSADDLLDIEADCIPASLLADNVHFNNYTQAGEFISRVLTAKGY
jgi:hypothetical protein